MAGAQGAGRLHPRTPDAHVTQADLDAALAQLRALGARFALIELPDTGATLPLRTLLLANAFRNAGRVDHLVADGVALLFLRREL